MGYSYEIDEDGDYRVSVILNDGESVRVGVSSRTLEVASVEFRDIWSVAGRFDGKLPDGLTESLLRDSWSSRSSGSWASAGRTSENREVIVYLVRIPANGSTRLLNAALIDAAQSARNLSEALARINDP